MKYLLLLLCSMSLQAWEDWNTENKELYKIYIYLNMIDAHMTYNLTQEYPQIKEINPLLNSKPSLEEIIILKTIGSFVFYKALDKNLNNNQRKKILKKTNILYMGIILNNGYIGFDLRKEF